MALTPSDIDHRCIRITGGKTKSAVRVIPLHPAISDLPDWVHKGGLAVFHNQATGKAQTDPVNSLRYNFSKLVKVLIDEPIIGERRALYSLRSTFQNALRRAGAPIEVRKAIMGHVERGAIRHYDDGPEFELLRKWVVAADPTAD
jgi:integrase